MAISLSFFCIFNILLYFNSDFSSILFDDVPSYRITKAWYRWGDSPVDDSGNFVWVLDRLELSKWREIRVSEQPEDRNGRVLMWEVIKLPENKGWENPVLYIDGVDEVFELYIHGDPKPILKYGDIDNPEYIGGPFFILPIKDDYWGKYLFFRVYSEHNIGIFGELIVDSKSDIVRYIIFNGLDKLILGVLFIIVGIGSLLFFVLVNKKGYVFSFGLASFVAGIFSISQPDLRFLLWNSPLVWAYSDSISFFLLPPTFLLFLYFVFKESSFNFVRSVLRFFLIVSGVFSLITIFLILFDFLGVYPPVALNINFFLVIIDLLVGIFISIYMAIKRQKEGYILLLGFSFLLAFSIPDVLVMMRIIEYSHIKSPIGVLLFFSSLAGLVIYKTRKLQEDYISLQRELNIAKNIQLSLLPEREIDINGVESNILYVPSRYVGGDFYDYSTLNREKAKVLVADVSGHGVPAALVSSMVKLAFSNFKKEDYSPDFILSSMNRILFFNARTLITAVLLDIDCKNNMIRTSRAGHLPVLLHRRDTNSIMELNPSGMAIGIKEDIKTEIIEESFFEKDRVILYTDGIIEARNHYSKEMFGIERFKIFIDDNKNVSSQKFIEKLYDLLRDWTGNFIEDDITIIIIDKV